MIAAAARHTEIVEYLLGEEETEPEIRQSPEAVVSLICTIEHLTLINLVDDSFSEDHQTLKI